MKNDKFRVSVAICTYNGEKYLGEQLDSILEQTRQPDEITLLDDNSSDGTLILAENKLKKSGIPYHILQHKQNLGVKVSFTECILACSGDIVFTADQDDVWRKDKIALMLEEFDNDPRCVMVFSNAELVDAEGKSLGCDVWTALNLRRAGLRNHIPQEDYRRLIMYTWAVPGTTMGVRRDFAEKAFPVPEEGGYIHDSWLAVTAPVYGIVTAVDLPLTAYRQHGKNTVGVHFKKHGPRHQDILQLRKVLFYLKRHAARLRVVLNVKGKVLPADYRMELTESIELFERYAHYEGDGAVKKILFLLARTIDGGLGRFHISRRDVFYYLLHQIFRRRGGRSSE
ncbi:MAG: glycosyltransferase family 2 protein [Lachnospiraceae bacterium]|nr:glycosyltransferase family 2 protein [Lachnospiraceae bacterium]